jgi:hypothetical protein
MGKLGQLLVARGWLTVQQLTRALKNQNVVGGRLGTCLLEMEVLGEELLARSLSEQLGVPAGDIEDLRAIPDEVLSLIPEKLARRCRAIPFRVAGGRLDVVMQDPRNLVCQDEIAFACGRRVKVHVLHELRIQEALQRYYREECPSRYSLLLDRLNRARYMWGGAGRQGRAKAADETGDSTEVLSRLPADDLLGGPPRFEPPPLPEPALPSKLRRSWRTSTNAVVAPPTGSAAGTSAAPAATASAARPSAPGESLPPLAELDLRATPRRQRALDASGRPVTPAPTSPQPEAQAASAPSAAARAPIGSPPALAPAVPAAGSPDVDLDATLALRPPAAVTATPPLPLTSPTALLTSSGSSESGSPERRGARIAPHPLVTLSDAERAELEAASPAAAASAVLSAPTLPASPTAPAMPTSPALSTPPASPPSPVPPAMTASPAVPVPPAMTASPAVPAPPALPAPPGARPREAPATLAEVEEAFVATTDREEVGRILLGFLARSFRRVALFQASRDRITAWMAHGDDIDQEAFGRYSVDFKQPSLFLNLREGSGVHIGPVAPMESHRELALCWGGGLPRECVALPVRLRDRLVLVLYLDGGARGLGGVDLEQMQRLTALTAVAFERCILHKKRGYAQS